MKWEYKVVTLWHKDLSDASADNIELLNEDGQLSWELVSVDNGIAYFKRPISEHLPDFERLNQLAKVERVEIETPTEYDSNLQYKIVDGSENIFVGGSFVDKDFIKSD